MSTETTPAIRRAAAKLYDQRLVGGQYARTSLADPGQRQEALVDATLAVTAALAGPEAIEEMAQALIDHTRINGIHGDCSCGHVVPLGRSFAAHQAAGMRAALLGSAS